MINKTKCSVDENESSYYVDVLVDYLNTIKFTKEQERKLEELLERINYNIY